MDATQFDRLSRALSARPTRRAALGLLAGGLLGGLLSRRQTAHAQECTRCGGSCVDIASDPYHCGGRGVVCAAG
jgi:hypothetical protein